MVSCGRMQYFGEFFERRSENIEEKPK